MNGTSPHTDDLDAHRTERARKVRHIVPGGLLHLLQFLFTSNSLIKFLSIGGCIVLPLALLSWFASKYFAYGLVIYIYIASLVLPYLLLAPATSLLLGSRRLALIPGFAFTAGIASFLLTALLAGIMPLFTWMLGITGVSPLLGVTIFVTASLYTAIMHFCLSSRYAPLLASSIPVAIVIGFFLIEERTGGLISRPASMLSLFILCIFGWLLALRRLYVRNSFKGMYRVQNTGLSRDYDYTRDSISGDWLFAGRNIPAASSLLLAYPATVPGRLVNTLATMLISPVMCALFLTILSLDEEPGLGFFSMLIIFNLFMSAFYPWAWGELLARGRLLWLRMAGDRSRFWRFIEGQIVVNYASMFSISVLLYALAWLLPALDAPGAIFLLLSISAGLHNGYFNIMARARHWASWMQALGMILTLAATGAALVYAIKTEDYLFLQLLCPLLLMLTFVYRGSARRAFDEVDWLRLKPVFNVHRTGQ